MTNIIQPYHLLVIALAGWLNRQQQDVIDYLIEENRVLNEYITHYHVERNHQGLGNRLLDPTHDAGSTDNPIQHRERLGGILNYYYREAA